MKSSSPYITHKLPIDAQGFTTSFTIDSYNKQEVSKFYHTYGLVIFNNILTKEQVQKSIEDLWKDLNQYSQGKIKRQNPQTWNFDGMLKNFGFVNHRPLHQPQIWKNRSNQKLYRAFKLLSEISGKQQIKQPLLACFDRGSVLRPSRINQNWKTKPIYHFDIHPWWWTNVVKSSQAEWRSYNRYDQTFSDWLGEGNYVPRVRNHTILQGVIGLSDTNAQSGGFECVCGFQNYIKQWCENTKEYTDIVDCPQLMQNMQKVYQRAGSVIIFSRQLPHNIYPNISDKFRYAQYVRIVPQSTLMLTPTQKTEREKRVQEMLPYNLNYDDPIIRQLYMISEHRRKQCEIY